ncbi:hypothetical protein IMZ29_10055 [Achromobacter sp. GG226]|uniref:toxin-antitoxin system YwqK family antitoxin n=1 Tax=Verticiella alkaliphila TaxID=2779529 RepID=UPI001C0E3358|nr:hypothetical protein [Verticiella sp. GG226]
MAEPAEATEATDAPEPAAIAPALWLDGDYRPVAREDAEFGGELEANEDDAWTLHVLDLDNGRRRASLTLDGPDPATASHAGRFQTYHDNGQPRTVGEYDDQRHFTGVLKGFNDEGVQLSRIEVRGNDRHGKDIRYHDDGKTVRSETDFVDGKQHGTHRAYFPGGEGALRTQAHFREGKRHGVLRHYYPNGQLRSELTYEDGTVEGASRRWAQDGTLTRDETLRNGKPIGESRHFHNDGTPRRVVIYDDEGARQKDTRFYPDGQVQRVWSQETFEGKPVQAERRFARDGQILSETLRSEDRRHRWVKGWGADGTLRQDIYYLDGSPDGLARRMTGRNGYSLTEYADGKRHGKFESHRDGKLFERGEYHEGQRTGRWERYEDDTVRVSEYNREGRSHGEVSLTVAGELRRFETYRHGVRHGRYEMRNSDGVVRERGNYVDGERDGPWIVALQDLRLESEAMVSMAQGEYRLGKRVGTWEARLGPGYLIERVTFNDEGERHGPMYRFAEDGRLLMHATFVNGMANGRYIQNEPDGTPRTDGIVKDDRLVEDYLEDDVSAGASG